MAARARVIISTVGPYTRYGLPLVAACAAAGTDYADLTGETMFIRDSIDTYHKEATDTGARIVHSCGFDSVPSDLTVYALHKRAQEDNAGELLDTTLVVRRFAGGVSGGTVASMLEVMRTSSTNPTARAEMADPYTLSTDRGAEPDLGPQSDIAWRKGAQIAPELAGTWTGAFVMGAPNARIVRRSNALLGWAYGRKFHDTESMSMGSSPLSPVAAAVGTATNAAVMALGSRYFDKLPSRLVERIVPKPG
ncbi:MAG: saccharopine dehydrogenase, partial [Mycobacterium sp.]|nr:saccharopine dehydrogenase [Mycobacterium sp.]